MAVTCKTAEIQIKKHQHVLWYTRFYAKFPTSSNKVQRILHNIKYYRSYTR